MSWDRTADRVARAHVMEACAYPYLKGRPYYTDSHGQAIITGPKNNRLQKAWEKSCAEMQERAASDPEAAKAWAQSQLDAREAYRKTKENWDQANRRIDLALIEDQKRRQALWDSMFGQSKEPAATGQHPAVSPAHPKPEYPLANTVPPGASSPWPSTGLPAGPYSPTSAESEYDSVVDMLRAGAAAAGVAAVGACATWVTVRKLLRRRKAQQQRSQLDKPSEEEDADT